MCVANNRKRRLSIASEPRLSRATGPIDGLQLRRTTVCTVNPRHATTERASRFKHILRLIWDVCSRSRLNYVYRIRREKFTRQIVC